MNADNYPSVSISKKTERESIRSQLRVRWNTEYGCYEVHTTIHGSGVFRWFKITEGLKNWYVNKFNIQVEPYVAVNPNGTLKNFNPTAN